MDCDDLVRGLADLLECEFFSSLSCALLAALMISIDTSAMANTAI